MTQEQFAQRMQEIITSPELIAKLEAGASKEEIAEFFKANGIDIPAEEMEAFFDQMINAAAEGELDEEKLENVAGGGLKDIIDWGKKLIGIANDCKPDGKYGKTIQKAFDVVYNIGFKNGWWR